MSLGDRRALVASVEHLRGELPDRLEEREPRGLAVEVLRADEALIGERREAVEHVDAEVLRRPGGRLRRHGVEAATEHGEPIEQPARARVEELVAPGDRAAQRLLPLRQIAGAGRKEAELALESREDRVWREEL